MEYTVISRTLCYKGALCDFIQEVNDRIKEGWKPYGELVVIPKEDEELDSKDLCCMQVMIKE